MPQVNAFVVMQNSQNQNNVGAIYFFGIIVPLALLIIYWIVKKICKIIKSKSKYHK